jgi:hypothetical protein
MAIKRLNNLTIAQFSGKKSFANLTSMEPGQLLSGKNVLVMEDRRLRRAPGYTLVTNVDAGPIQGQPFDFQRSVDGRQYIFVQSGGTIYAMNPDGSGKVALASGEVGVHQFVSTAIIAYSSDGTNAYRYVDNNGTLTRYNWGIVAPAVAPAIAIGAGTLTLTYGRTYVYCYVAKYVDSLGIQRVSVSAPSPISAHTGPIASEVVTLSGLQVSGDTQVNYKWIFEVTDSPFNTSATYFFAAEIPNSQTSWGDTLVDDALDQTRLAPFDNNPAPPAPLLDEFQNRIVAVNGGLIQISGYSEIQLGIPQEAWPESLFFNLPSGKRKATAVAASQDGSVLYVADGDFWYEYQGYDATTFTENDRVASPSAAGPLALCPTPFGLAYLAPNRRLYLWKGAGSEATDISSEVAQALPGTYSMDDLDQASVSRAVLRWFSYGSLSFLAVFCRTSDAPDANLNLIQIWSVAVTSGASSGLYGGSSTVYGQLSGIYQTDKIPSVTMTAAGTVEVGSVPYLYLGDANGNLYRFPDGFTDNGNPYLGVGQLSWLIPYEGKSNFLSIDVTTDRLNAANSFQIYAMAADAPDQSLTPTLLDVQTLPSPVGATGLTIRAGLNLAGVATGKYITVFLAMPNDENEAVISKVILWSRPTAPGMP